MIPYGLEKLILAGKADAKTYCIGGSGVGTIPVSQNTEYIVVYGFIWCPFHDYGLAQAQTQIKMIHTMRFNNGLKMSMFNFRDVLTTNGIINSPYYVPAYFLSKQDLKIDIYKFGLVKTWDYDTVQPETQEPGKPLGYAGNKAVLSIETNAGGVVNTMGEKRNPGAVSVGNTAIGRNEFFDNITDDGLGEYTGLENPTAKPQWAFPVVTFNYVEVFKLGTNKNR